VLENEGSDYFSVKLNVSGRHRKADGKCCQTSGNAVIGCASAGTSGLCGRMVIPRVGIWRRRKTRPGGCTDSKSARNRKGLSPDVRRKGELGKFVYSEIAGQRRGDSECQRDEGTKERRPEQCEYRLADRQEKDARRHAKCEGAKNSRASIFGKESDE
jgi:hypothetical protein